MVCPDTLHLHDRTLTHIQVTLLWTASGAAAERGLPQTLQGHADV